LPVDELVRTRAMTERRLAIGDPFIADILRHGKLPYGGKFGPWPAFPWH